MLIDLLRRKLDRHHLVRGALCVSVGNVLGIAVLVLATPLITRLYAPADLGILGVYTSLLMIVGGVVTLRYEAAIALPQDEVTSVNVVALCILLAISSGMVLTGTLWLLQETLRSVNWLSGIQPYALLFAVTAAVIGMHQSFVYWAVRRGAFSQLGWLRLIACLITVLVQITFGWLAVGARGLLAGVSLSYCCGPAILLLAAAIRPSVLRGLSWKAMKKAAWRYRGFAVYSTSATVLARLSVQLTPLLLAVFYGLEVAGCYALAQRILASPLSALVNPVARVFGSQAARIQREETGGLDLFLERTIRRVVCFAVLPTLVMILFIPWVCAIALGPAWRESGVYCWILAPMLLTLMVADTVSPTLDVLEKQRPALWLHMLSAAAVVACVVAGCVLRLSPRMMLAGLSLAVSGANGLMVWLCWRYARDASASWLRARTSTFSSLARAA